MKKSVFIVAKNEIFRIQDELSIIGVYFDINGKTCKKQSPQVLFSYSKKDGVFIVGRNDDNFITDVFAKQIFDAYIYTKIECDEYQDCVLNNNRKAVINIKNNTIIFPTYFIAPIEVKKSDISAYISEAYSNKANARATAFTFISEYFNTN